MYHLIETITDLTLDLESSPKQPLERLQVAEGSRLRAQLRPSIFETDEGPVEVADLFFEDGSATRRVPFACFAFVE